MLFLGKGDFFIGSGVTIGFNPSPYFFATYAHIEARNPGAKIVIGDNTHISNSFVAIAEFSGIFIGKYCHIGSNVEIIDSDFHALSADARRAGVFAVSKPVIINDDVFIGSNVKIMKGVNIGAAAVIANGAVLFSDVPAGATAFGNPASVRLR